MNEPRVEAIPAEKLIVDRRVQRGVDKARVVKIVSDFHSDSLGAAVVSRRDDGTNHVVDGQHRVAAVVAAGREKDPITCLVYEGLTLAEEAAMFRRLNNTRAVMPVDRFRVRVVEGERNAVVLNNILIRHGWTVSQQKQDGFFAAVSAFESVLNGKLNGEGGTAGICDTLIGVITEAWGHDDQGVRGEIISGLGAMLLRYNSLIDLPKLTSVLGTVSGGPRGLVGRSKGLRDLRGGKLSDAIAEVVVEMLNKNRRVGRLPHWRSQA